MRGIALGAKHGTNAAYSQLLQLVGALLEGIRIHMVGKSTQALVERRVRRVRPRGAHSAQLSSGPVIGNAGMLAGQAQGVVVELRIVPRTRLSAHIDQRIHACGLQQSDQFLDRAVAVTDRIERERHVEDIL